MQTTVAASSERREARRCEPQPLVRTSDERPYGASPDPNPATYRPASRRVVIYGRNPVREALVGRRGPMVREIWATEGAAREPWLARAQVRIVRAGQVAERCGSESHQGVCAEAGPYPYVETRALLERQDPLIVVLDHVQDPQNLGSIARTAECAGADGVVIHERGSAEVTPAVCKASAGAVEHLGVTRVRNVADFIAEAQRAGCWCYGASVPQPGDGDGGDGEASPGARSAGRGRGEPARGRAGASGHSAGERAGERVVSYEEPDYSGGVVLVVGSEGRGLRPRVAASCDQLVSLPVRGRIESLGVAAATAAILYWIVRDRNGPVAMAEKGT